MRITLSILPLLLGLLALAQAQSEETFMTRVRQLTYEGKRAGEGYFNAEGNKIIFQSEREAENPFYQIYILDLQTGDTRRVSPGTGKTTCSWFQPGTQRVLFGSTHADPEALKKQKDEMDFRNSGQTRRYSWDYDPTMDIWSCNQDGSDLKQLTTEKGYDAEGAYSPDGKKIVYCSLRAMYEDQLTEKEQKLKDMDPSYFGEVYIMDADGSNKKRLTTWPGYDGGTFFSSDGQRIIWRHFDPTGKTADVYSMKLDGSDKIRHTDFGSLSWAPIYHPSGEYIIFSSNKLGFSNFELFIVDAKGEKEPVQVTYKDGFDGLAMFHPSGNQITFTSNRTGNGTSQLFLAEWNHAAALKALAAAPPRGSALPADGHAHPEGDGHNHGPSGSATPGDQLHKDNLKAAVEFLAGDNMEGRLTGSDDTRRAAEWLRDQLKQAGYLPVNGEYLQSFTFLKEVKIGPNNVLSLQNNPKKGPFTLKGVQKIRPLAFSDSALSRGPILFAGYGLQTGPHGKVQHDSYAGLAKPAEKPVVVVIDDLPPAMSVDHKDALSHVASARQKVQAAKDNGAAAVVLVSLADTLTAPSAMGTEADACGLPVLRISYPAFVEMAAYLKWPVATLRDEVRKDGLVLAELEKNWQALLAKAPKATAELNADLQRVRGTDYNVVAYLPPAGATAYSTGQESVLLSAHYDHLGHGEVSSLARSGEGGHIHNGADDNASGTATVLGLAQHLASLRRQQPERFKRGVIVGLWSGEELGVLGSQAFCQSAAIPLASIKAAYNFDMVGRLKDNKLTIQGAGSSSEWRGMAEKYNIMAGFDLNVLDDPYVPTDGVNFYTNNIPTLNFFTGLHDDYHRPSDDLHLIDYDGMERIARLAERFVLNTTERTQGPDYQQVARSHGGGRKGVGGIYTGTIPDYTADVKGMRLNGVRPGSPAEKAGLKGGDIIIELAGKPVESIYDYSHLLGLLKAGKEVDLKVNRDGQTVALKLTPESK